jgi:hypothetical protein
MFLFVCAFALSIRLPIYFIAAPLSRCVLGVRATAKQKLAAKNKTAAMAHLKRKKNYEAQIEKIQGSRLTLETQMVKNFALNVSSSNIAAGCFHRRRRVRFFRMRTHDR